MTKLWKKWADGIREMGEDPDNIKTNWGYCGGEPCDYAPQHYNTWKIKMKDIDLPRYRGSERNCPCGKEGLKYLCFLTPNKGVAGHKKEVIPCGNCCIKKFIEGGAVRRCSDCNKMCRRKCGICLECERIPRCKKCGTGRARKFGELCEGCSEGKCESCSRVINPVYILCYICHSKK